MNRYIATFYSHFGAVRFSKELKDLCMNVKLGPVPRFLSSSCGTCAEFEYDRDLCEKDAFDEFSGRLSHPGELEGLVILTGDSYRVIFDGR